MSIERVSVPWLIPLPGSVPDRPSGSADGGPRVASVTTVDGPDGAVLRVVVTWLEAGKRVVRIVEVPE